MLGQVVGTKGRLWYNRKGSLKKPSKIQSLENRLKRVEKGGNKELKTHDYTHSGQDITNTGVVYHISNIAQGSSSLTRNGLEIRLHSVYFKTYSTHSSAIGSHNRNILFFDTENDGALPGVADVLETASSLAFKEHDEKGRFKFIWDTNWTQNLKAVGNLELHYKEKYKRFKNPKTIYYRGTASPVANAGKNNLFLLVIGNLGSTYDEQIVNIRLRFTG